MFKQTINLLIIFSLSLVFTACPDKTFEDEKAMSNSDKIVVDGNDSIIFLMTTTEGDIEFVLYNETPEHKANFLKLVQENYYDSLLFHRVMKEFMIQAGDPGSKTSPSGEQLGDGGPGYTVPRDFNPSLIHKKGALAAARQPDNVNPDKASSGSQFYIVQGQVYDSVKLEQLIEGVNQSRLQAALRAYLFLPENTAKLNEVRNLQSVSADKVNAYVESFKDSVSYSKIEYTAEQKEVYKTIGGTPFLDGEYTVYGEVTKGMDIIDKIAGVNVDGASRPLNDVRILSVKIIK